jgi:MerR family copper efflux transcriptional regulator
MATTDNHRHLAVLHDATASQSQELRSSPGGVEPEGEGLLQVGDLAKATGKTVRAIHLYEDLGLLRPQDRSKGRYRLFSPDAIVRVRWINKLQSLGLSLSQIQEVAREQEASGSAMFAAAKLREVYLEKLAVTREKIRELALLEGELVASLKYLNTCDTSCEPAVLVSSCPTCERHPEPTHDAPDLVVGVHLS